MYVCMYIVFVISPYLTSPSDQRWQCQKLQTQQNTEHLMVAPLGRLQVP